MALSRLGPGQAAVVRSLGAQGPLRGRLQSLGFVPGAAVECLFRGPLGDPAAYRVRGGVTALRGRDARLIEVRLEAGGEGWLWSRIRRGRG